jgi:glyoxylase-like metal-dependent hydrolase (beta-lactamase superfamily II)
MLKIKQIPVGTMNVNCYVLYNEHNNAIIVDPSTNTEALFKYISSKNLRIQAMILTHGHFDHIEVTDQIIDEYGCGLIIHIEDADMLTDSDKNVSSMVGRFVTVNTVPTRFLHDNDDVMLDSDCIHIIHTPGHTPGGICLLCDNFILVGDTLFKGAYGRTDFPRGNQTRLFHSIRTKLLTLNEDLIVYPGHGDSTSIKEEKKHW